MATFPAPAKINLFLRVTGRRDDGYHTLQTAFQFIDLEDKVEIDVTDDGSITRLLGVPDVSDEDDLAIRAARLLARHTGCTQGAQIAVTKRIPAGAGLGGGSSDAATVLVALNQLWQLGLGESTLATLGLTLGADVPVFVRGRGAFAEGIGEDLIPHDWPEKHGLLVVPPVHVSTPRVFTDAQLTRNTPAITIRDAEAAPPVNDLAPVARRLFPQVAEAMQALDELADFEPPRLSGSGGGVFAFDTLGSENATGRERLAAGLEQTLNQSGLEYGSGSQSTQGMQWRVWPFRTMNRSSLFAD